MSESFTNGQLGGMIKDGFEKVHARQDKTNGRISNIELWKAKMHGMWIILACIVIPLAISVVGTKVKGNMEHEQDMVKLEQLLDKVVAEKLQAQSAIQLTTRR